MATVFETKDGMQQSPLVVTLSPPSFLNVDLLILLSMKSVVSLHQDSRVATC
jgi:hypothetical protein